MGAQSTIRRTAPLTAAVTMLATAAVLVVSAPETPPPSTTGLSQQRTATSPPTTRPARSVTPTAAAGPGPTAVSTAGTAVTAPSLLAAGSVRLPRGSTARLVRRDVRPDGTLPVPDGVTEVTWWGSDLLAASGAAVLAGHVNWQGEVGPFAELWQAEHGGHIEVADRHGRLHRYRITEVHTVVKNDLPRRAPDLFAQHGPHRIVLVTCGGRWVGGPLGFEANRIVVGQLD
ncbi:class F sortase [Micromonospora sp. CP22]|uniref:class F sortase n=1 Tax=Micromonospora sp. CP22 TaxID=2580517 RepID=UPI001E6118AB|nr:class F sortase [Micromonospora sp. CP22]